MTDPILDQLAPLRDISAYVPLLDLVVEGLVQAGRARIEVVQPGVLRLHSECVTFDLCFWLRGESRFSLFIGEWEALDDFLADADQAADCARYVREIFSNAVEVETHRDAKKGKVVKRVYRYTALDPSGHPTPVEERALLALMLPWEKRSVDTLVVPPLLGPTEARP